MRFRTLTGGMRYVAQFVAQTNARQLIKLCPFRDPDVFSLDIDGIDYYVAKAIIDEGYRPKIMIVEYNSAFGRNNQSPFPIRPISDGFGNTPWALPPSVRGVHCSRGTDTILSPRSEAGLTRSSSIRLIFRPDIPGRSSASISA
jgi:hypothetical protein